MVRLCERGEIYDLCSLFRYRYMLLLCACVRQSNMIRRHYLCILGFPNSPFPPFSSLSHSPNLRHGRRLAFSGAVFSILAKLCRISKFACLRVSHFSAPSANAHSALQHHLSGSLSLSLFKTVTRLHYLNLDLKHICSPPSMLLNCPVRQRL